MSINFFEKRMSGADLFKCKKLTRLDEKDTFRKLTLSIVGDN